MKGYVLLFLFAPVLGFSGVTGTATTETIGPVSRHEFFSAIARVQSAYEPGVKFHGGRLKIFGDWNKKFFEARTERIYGTWKIIISGEMARIPTMTTDGLTSILCHEVGHYLAGHPFIPSKFSILNDWSAAEGQADYFSNQVCLKRVWQNDKIKNAEFRQTASAQIRTICDSAWATEASQNLCYRILEASRDVVNSMAALKGEHQPSFGTPDTTMVNKTNHSYPSTQCRMDTMLQAALCPVVFDQSVIPGTEAESARSTCTRQGGHWVGARPTCWFEGSL